MGFKNWRAAYLPLAAAMLLLAAPPQARAQGVMDSLTDQAREKAMDELQKRTGGVTIPGQDSVSGDEQNDAAAQAPVARSAGNKFDKVLVWGDPSLETYYYEGDELYGKADGGRCMYEKLAKKKGLKSATSRDSKKSRKKAKKKADN
jgi:hypothetical protein